MRMLLYRYSDLLDNKILPMIPKPFLNRDGTIKEEEWQQETKKNHTEYTKKNNTKDRKETKRKRR